MRKQAIFLLLCDLTARIVSGQPSLRINQIQVIGTHNSYHAGLGPHEMAFLRQQNAKAAAALDYSHPSLTVQLNGGVRQVEIDVYGDAKGGLFAKPAWPGLMAKAGVTLDPPFDPAGVMLKPGFKVLHAQDLDYRSNCQPFVGCLEEIRAWSKGHPGHLPVFILIENKDGRPRPEYMVEPEALTADTFDRLDAEIRSVFKAGELITPDDVRGRFSALEEAVLKTGWPTVETSRGKVMFVLDQERVGPLVLEGHPSLRGRVVFTNSTPGRPDGAFVKLNHPLADAVREAVLKGYMVRTMADGGGAARREAALGSGAQMVSTDHPAEFKVMARCNPVLKPTPCAIDQR